MHISARGPYKNILVVDDQRKNALEVAEYFNSRGFQVHTATSAHEALFMILQEPIDLVLLKSHLPGLTGYEIGPILKKIKPGVRVMFIMEDAPQQELSQKSEETLFFECFSAPLDLEKVWKAINV